MPPPTDRITIGKSGEDYACRELERRGYEILARRFRTRLGEIDIVAREDDTLVFVEVKARRGLPGDPPQAAVDARKRARISRLALGYLSARRLGERSCRFDVIGVSLDDGGGVTAVRHLKHAFGLEGWTP
jgi:putative endonuclease